MPITVKHVSYVYNPGTTFAKTALDDVSVTIEDGSFVGLIGHTGSGKSTLIQMLNGLLTPTSGEVWVDGENIHASKAGLVALRRKVGLVFQYPEHQLFEMSVYKDVAFGPKNLGLTGDELDERVRRSLAVVGMGPEMYEKSPFDLSGGQKRRVAIAGVLAMAPQTLVLDEPTAGLDPQGREEILQAVSDMHKQLGLTVVLVSHSMEDTARLADRILVMAGGRLAMTGTPREIFSRVDELEQIGLTAPQISFVFRELRARGWDLPADVYTVDEAVALLRQVLQKRPG